MQRLVPKLLLLLSLFASVSCEKDLEYDLPGAKPQLVLNSLFTSDSVIRFEISVSASPGQGQNIQSLRDAKITLFEDQVQIKDFSMDSMFATPFNFSGLPNASLAPIKLFYHHTIASTAKGGKNYRITVKYPELETVSSSTVVPRPVKVRPGTDTLGTAINVDGKPMVLRSFEMDDNGTRGNHYGIEVLAVEHGRENFPEKITFFSGEKSFAENIVVSDGQQHNEGVYYEPQNGVYFGNGKFQGRTKSFEFYIDPQYISSQYSLKVRVLTLSRDFFEFVTTYQRQKNNASNPFAEPTPVYSNVVNGLGIFAGYAVTEVDL